MSFTTGLFVVLLASWLPLSIQTGVPNTGYLAPLSLAGQQNGTQNEYLVVFYPNHTLEQHFHVIGRNLSSAPNFKTYDFGYAATFDDETRDEQVRRDSGVRMVELNVPIIPIVPVERHQVSPLPPGADPLSKRDYDEDRGQGAPYGLQMLTTGSTRLDIPVLNNGTYDYLRGAGKGVQVYVVDSGIRISHRLFNGRARNFGNLRPTDKSPYVDEIMDDLIGHGTHVAGTIGAQQYGVAPYADLINVKIYGKNKIPPVGNIAQAVIDITKEHIANKEKGGTGVEDWKFRGSVINMSFRHDGGGFGLLWQLIEANKAGISVYAAAGNDNRDASTTFPCANVQAKCIAAVDATYNKAKFSNYGSSVDFIAPGEAILSLGNENDDAIASMSGTSMACPHAAGAAAIFASWKGLVSDSDLSESLVYWNSIDGVVSGFPGSTTTHFVTTGIHSPKKYQKEPFRWGEDDPQRNHAINPTDTAVAGAESLLANISAVAGAVGDLGGTPKPSTYAVPSTPSSSDFISNPYTTGMATSTVMAATGLTTVTGDSTFDPAIGTASSTAPAGPTPTCATTGTTFPQAPAQKLIETFCAEPNVNADFVPYIAFGNGTSQDGKPKSINAEGHYKLDGTPNDIWMRIRFPPGNCVDPFNGSDHCSQWMSTILNGCGTNTITNKLGGTLVNGCAEYTLTVVDDHTDPFKKDRDYATGDLICTDTIEEPKSPFNNTCSCWMSDVRGQAAIFAKPPGGCNGKDVDQKNGLVPGQGY